MVPCHHYPSVCATLVLLGSLGSRDKNHMGTPMVPCHSEFHFGVVGYRTNARTKTNVRPENTVLRKRVPGRRPPCGVNTVEYRHVMCDSADRPASRAMGGQGRKAAHTKRCHGPSPTCARQGKKDGRGTDTCNSSLQAPQATQGEDEVGGTQVKIWQGTNSDTHWTRTGVM